MTKTDDTGTMSREENILDELYQLLSQGDVTRESLRPAARLGKVEAVPAGTKFGYRDDGDSIRLLLEGSANLLYPVPGHEDAIVSSLYRGEILGWGGLLSVPPWPAIALTLEPSTFITWEGPALRKLFESNREIAFFLLRKALENISSKLEDAFLRIIDMYRNPANS